MKSTRLFYSLSVTLALAGALALFPRSSASAETGHSQTAESGSPASVQPPPLLASLDQYIKIQTALAADSLKGIPEAASAIAETAKSNVGILPEGLASQATSLAKAGDLQSASPPSNLLVSRSSKRFLHRRKKRANISRQPARWLERLGSRSARKLPTRITVPAC